MGKSRFRIGRGRRRGRASRSQIAKDKKKKIKAMLNKHLHSRFQTDSTDLVIQCNAGGTGTSFVTKQLVFQLNEVAQYSQLKAMYDQYKINFVEIFMSWSPELLPIAHTNGSGKPEHRAGILPSVLKVFHCPDYDDSDPLTMDEFRQRAKTKLTLLKPQQRVKIIVKPAVLSQIYETLTSTGYQPKWNVKLDTNDDNIPHYGYKFGVVQPESIDNTTPVSLGKIDFEVRYNLTMYNTK